MRGYGHPTLRDRITRSDAFGGIQYGGRVSPSVQGPVKDPDPSGDLLLLSASLNAMRLEEDEDLLDDPRSRIPIVQEHQKT